MNDGAVERLFAVLPGARVVGGAVRDRLLGQQAADVDFAAPLPPERVIEHLRAAGVGFAPTGLKHGTVTAIINGRGYEITSLRRDVATDGRHAQVQYTDDWQEDAARRDFTFNALSMDQAGKIYDYFGGAEDLAEGRVRFVGDAAARVAEDYLRILRFFRFYARFGRGDPDPAAIAAITAGVPGLSRLSPERVWSELKGLLSTADPVPALRLMDQTGVLTTLLPGGSDIAAIARLGPADALLRFAALAPDAPRYAAVLRWSAAEHALIAGYCRVELPPAFASDDDLRRALDQVPRAHLIGASRLRGDKAEFQARIQAMPAPVFPLKGRDATALGVPAGERVGELLAELRAWWRSAGCTAPVEACRQELARRIRG